MFHLFQHLNVVAWLGVTVAGFVLGWLWYSPVLFARPWMQEMKLTPESFEEAKPQMGKLLAAGFFFTLMSTLGLYVVLHAAAAETLMDGLLFGAFIGAVIVGARMLNTSVWEGRTARLLRINLGHEVVVFAVQGAMLVQWG